MAVMDFAAKLLQWYDAHGRHDLPWQSDRTLYRVWIAEIMLQQTQVATVIPYYLRFMQRFPILGALAAAELDEVLHQWSGLGYYSRARNLHRAARLVAERHAGELPRELTALNALPGIGRSTAAAILAQATGARHAILDGNVRRVLSRCFALRGALGSAALERSLWDHAEQFTPVARLADYTQAIMDLGATVCTRRKPRCAECPLAADCRARALHLQHALPEPRQRAPRRERSVVMLLARRTDGCILLQQRAPEGVWGGLWSLPEFDRSDSAQLYCARRLSAWQPWPRSLPTVRHAFTHFDLNITPLPGDCRGDAGVLDEAATLWYNPRAPVSLGLPAPVSRLIAQVDEES